MFLLTSPRLPHPPGQRRGMSSQVVKCVVVTFEIRVFFAAVGTLVLSLGACIVHMIKLAVASLHLHIAASVVTFHNLIVAVYISVSCGTSQVTLPLAASSFVGALHLEIAYSSIIVVVFVGSKLFTVNWAGLCPFDAFPTEQVPTTGLHWVRD